jgi:hypothetical protein
MRAIEVVADASDTTAGRRYIVVVIAEKRGVRARGSRVEGRVVGWMRVWTKLVGVSDYLAAPCLLD